MVCRLGRRAKCGRQMLEVPLKIHQVKSNLFVVAVVPRPNETSLVVSAGLGLFADLPWWHPIDCRLLAMRCPTGDPANASGSVAGQVPLLE